jgi:TfoX/Sxy family transcriptional regulator of competence genes
VPYDEDLADRIRQLIDVPATEKKMFGGLAFLVNGNMSVAASGQGGLLVRVNPEQTAMLLKETGASEFEMGNRGPMVGWLRVDAAAVGKRAALVKWVNRGVAYARSLPPK